MPRPDYRHYRRNFTTEARTVIRAMQEAGMGTNELAAAVDKRKAWISQRLQGHRKLRAKDAQAMLAAIRVREARKGDMETTPISTVSAGNSANEGTATVSGIAG
jgi:hypothetical protein